MTLEERRQLEAWFSGGRATDPGIVRLLDKLVIKGDVLEFLGLDDFDAEMFDWSSDAWVNDALGHHAGPSVISFRGQMKTGQDTHNDLRKPLDRQVTRSRPMLMPAAARSRRPREVQPYPHDRSRVLRREGPAVVRGHLDHLGLSGAQGGRVMTTDDSTVSNPVEDPDPLGSFLGA